MVLGLVQSDLELLIEDTSAVVEIGELPVVYAGQSQLVQLFTNLLNNALKFRCTDIMPRVQVTAYYPDRRNLQVSWTGNPRLCRIDVSDNGIGFDPVFSNRIFQVFQRLHGCSEFEGTGIGLAICEKVATNHGGKISASG
ncbi:hypothetical protein DSL64_04260 [Dyadobacter luteus]|jgi:light-regulated signal transduction histidine kinase (bacteriophytochrome)|uniref:histidine kinase n=1 Tax=Dyadobacter luteus TaxID=2259619 RepID=A0A3D8YG22_9BACT|nr:ATP-binding protein [Dyadobacter luteus]REA63658.1 hypothetical protein DSL64_04260 [Dyadobacter luteus]